MNKLVVRRAAQLDVRSIREWFEGNEVGLGDRFLAELDEVVGRVRMAPAQFPEIGRSLRRGVASFDFTTTKVRGWASARSVSPRKRQGAPFPRLCLLGVTKRSPGR